MHKIPTPHDHFFRAALSNPKVARELLEQHLPAAIQKIMQWDSVRPCKESYVDPDLNEKIVDALFSVNLKDKTGYIYLLAEHQSTPDKLMPFRIIEYTVKILRNHLEQYPDEKTLPLVIPIVFYNGKQRYSHSTNIFDLFSENKPLAQEFMFESFKLVDLNQIPDKTLKQHIWAGMMQFFMKHAYDRKLPDQEIIQFFIYELKSDPTGLLFIQKIASYVYETRNVEDKTRFDKLIEESLKQKTGDTIMPTIAEHLREEGRQEGMQAGMQAGKHEGKQEVARNLFNRGFSVTEVAEITGLPAYEIAHLKEASEII